MKPKKKNRMLTDLARFGHGFVYAWHGICAAVLEERNFRFHLCAALYVFAAAHMAHIDATGVALLAICVFMMLGMELMNSAVERAVDKPDTTHWWSAGAAKIWRLEACWSRRLVRWSWASACLATRLL